LQHGKAVPRIFGMPLAYSPGRLSFKINAGGADGQTTQVS
jgi:hypothetical protein